MQFLLLFSNTYYFPNSSLGFSVILCLVSYVEHLFIVCVSLEFHLAFTEHIFKSRTPIAP